MRGGRLLGAGMLLEALMMYLRAGLSASSYVGGGMF